MPSILRRRPSLRTARNACLRELVPIALAAAAGALVCFSAAPARAQATVDHGVSVQRFGAAPGSRNYFSVRGARTDGERVWSAGVMANYAYKPLIVQSCRLPNDDIDSCEDEGAEAPRDRNVVENMITGDFVGSFTIVPRVQLGLRIPVMWVKGVGITDQGTDQPEGIDAVGLGDPELEAKFRVYGDAKGPIAVGVAPFVTAPLGQVTAEDDYVGDQHPTAGLRAILDGNFSGFTFAVNLAGAYRKEVEIGSAKVGSEFRYGLGLGYEVSPVFQVLAEGFGSTRFTSQNGENAMEGLGGIRIAPLSSSLSFTLGAGTAIVQGIGAPRLRAVFGVLYAAEGSDGDDDGVEGAADQCPTEPEDRDGYEDGDGCPDRDNDLDTIPDDADKCPSQPEDQDGFEDRDGCPEADNDKDGVPDTGDRCPDQAETKNGFKDDDGCPDEADADTDGVPDARDKCPNDAEDTDGFEDLDGCPDLDNDKDGIPDAQDECVEEPETKNDFEDEDGCPDEAPKGKGKARAKP